MTDKQKWIYNFESNWPIQCEEQNQTPINIDTSLLTPCNELCNLEIKYSPTTNCSVSFYENQNLTIDYTEGSFVKYNDNIYTLKQITFHTPSNHLLNNKKYDLEVCLIHSNREDNKSGLIISCLYQEGNFRGNEEMFINQFINELRINTKVDLEVGENWSAELLLPQRKSFYSYTGSLPFPPCSEDYTVIVFDTIGNIGPINLDILKSNLGKSSRSIVPTGKRTVFYSSGNVKTTEKINKDRYLQCKPKEIIETTKAPKETMPPLPVDSQAPFKKSVKNLFMIVFIVLFVICAYKTAYLLISNGMAQKFIETFVDKIVFRPSYGYGYGRENIIKTINISDFWNQQCRTVP